ncbi:hypothetical protein BLKGLAD_73000 (plasmid) [Burkholderia gladioli pv. gladioli]
MDLLLIIRAVEQRQSILEMSQQQVDALHIRAIIGENVQ